MGTVTRSARRRGARARRASSRPTSAVERIAHRRRTRAAAWCWRTARSSPPTSSCATPIRSACATSSGATRLPAEYNDAPRRLRAEAGTTFKVNLALTGLPKFTCLPEDRGQFGPTIHLLPDEKDVMRALKRRLRDGAARRARPSSRRSSGTSTRRSIRRCKDDAGPPQLRALRAVGAATSSRARRGRRRRRGTSSTCSRSAIASRRARAISSSTRSRCTRRRSSSTSASRRGHIHHVDNALRLRRPPAVRDADRRALLVQRRLPSRGLRHRRRRPQRRQPRAERRERMKLKIDFSLPKLVKLRLGFQLGLDVGARVDVRLQAARRRAAALEGGDRARRRQASRPELPEPGTTARSRPTKSRARRRPSVSARRRRGALRRGRGRRRRRGTRRGRDRPSSRRRRGVAAAVAAASGASFSSRCDQSSASTTFFVTMRA